MHFEAAARDLKNSPLERQIYRIVDISTCDFTSVIEVHLSVYPYPSFFCTDVCTGPVGDKSERSAEIDRDKVCIVDDSRPRHTVDDCDGEYYYQPQVLIHNLQSTP